ncbi:hypothetical protein PE36_08081 [Moritella sp. PE36]|nr:hypothetical protein PE36_08081 [Moritella sp. PE36]
MTCFVTSVVGALFGILFGGILLGYILDSLLAGSLEIGDAGTWLAAVSTFGAAIGTIGSLIMLNRQHKQNVIHQERVWKKQEESLDFARYRDHKAQFEQLLDTLEDKHKDFYVFGDRIKLYLSLFPCNSLCNDFLDYKYRLNQSDLTEAHPLNSAWKHIDKIDTILRDYHGGRVIKYGDGYRFKEQPNPTPIHQVELTILNTAGCLWLKCIRAPRTGDLIHDDEVFANVIDPMVMRSHSADIFESLSEFCGIESPRESMGIYTPMNLGFELFSYFSREDVPKYNNIIHGHYNIVAILFELDCLVSLLPSGHPFVLFFRMSLSPRGDKALLKGIDDKSRVKDYLNQVNRQLRDIIKGEEYSEDAQKQAQQIIICIKEHAQ